MPRCSRPAWTIVRVSGMSLFPCEIRGANETPLVQPPSRPNIVKRKGVLVSEHLRQNITAIALTEGVELTRLRGFSAFPPIGWWHVHCLVLAHVSISQLCLELNSALRTGTTA